MDRILHIPNYYKPHIGGIEQTCHDIVDSLTGAYEQKVLCFSEDEQDKCEIIDGVEVRKCGVWKKVLSQSISFSYKEALDEYFNNYKPNIVIFHYPNPYVAHFLLPYLKDNNIRFILWYHMDIVKQKFIRKFFDLQTKRLINRANQIVTTSPIYKEKSKFLKNVQEKVIVIPSCINEKRLILTDAEKDKAIKLKEELKDKKIVFSFGRHVKYKGFRYLIEASKYLDESFKIFIGGTGPLLEKNKNLAFGDNKVEFLGKLSDSDLKVYLSIMDIYAFPSITKNEAFGLALAEGMYFKKPAVTFTIEGSGVNYVSINNVTGLEAENRNSLDFARCINELGKNEKMKEEYALNAYKRVEELMLFKDFKINCLNLLNDN